MIRQELIRLIGEAVQRAQAAGKLPAFPVPDIAIERPKKVEHGDYATNVALLCARPSKRPPLAIAQAIAESIQAPDFLGRVEVAPPGFINFALNPTWLASRVAEINALGDRFGAVDVGHGKRVQVEFVSANPTGPLVVPSGRAGALGDALANVLSFAGYAVEREYLINDAGSRMGEFFATAWARYQQQFGRAVEVPADGYRGAYMVDLAKAIVAEHGDRFLNAAPEQAAPPVGRLALAMILASMRADMDDLGVKYDVWFSEQGMYDDGRVNAGIKLVRERGYVADRDGAVWFTSSDLGEEKDNVLIRRTGVPTYFASDIAYHYDKFVTRGFDWVINIWGADHQGHVPRMKAAMEAIGVDPSRLTLLIHQMITLKRGAEVIKMSKRTGDFVTLREVLDEVGRDACRFFFLMRATDTHMDFDLDLATRQSDDNPVFYVQYAHARIASILRRAGDRPNGEPNLTRLTTEPELTLIRKMLQLPEVVERVAATLEPHSLPYYAHELAGEFHAFYKHCLVLSDDAELTTARLALVQATKTVLGTVLRLMGVSAPEEMARLAIDDAVAAGA